MAWAFAATAQNAPSAEQSKTEETPEVQEVVVTGSRIAAPNEVSTSPIQVVTSQTMQTTGKTDITDIINQLPQNFNNAIGQDLGNGTSGLSTPGGVATADLRGLGPNRTLVLVDGRRLGQGSPNTAIAAPAPDLDQIPLALVDRVEVVTGGASATYGSDAIAGVVNFIMKKNFEGLQIGGQFNANWHDNHNDFMQQQVREFGATPPTGTSFDGKQRSFDVLIGTNFADGNGNVTGYLGYRHADPVTSSQRDFGGCQLDPVTDAAHNVVGGTCGGSANSNFFNPFAPGLNIPTGYSVHGNGLIPQGTGVATTPPAAFNSQPYIYMTRENDRYNGAFLGHLTINDYVQPYAELYFMNDQTRTAIAPSGLFLDANPLDPTGTGGYPVNCDNPLLGAQQASILCSPAQLAYVAANPGRPCIFNTDPKTGAVTSPNCADVRIGRRNIEGGGREFLYEHTNYRGVFGSKGELSDVWTYDAYGQYYYTNFFNSNDKFLSFQSIDNALQVTGTRASPKCISGGSCVPYNIWSDGGVTPDQLQYLYLKGTAWGTATLRTLHADVTGELGKYGITSPWARDGVGVNVGYEHRSETITYSPDAAEESGLLSGFGSASVAIDNSVSVSEAFAELRAPLVQDAPGVKDLLFDTGFRRSDYTSVGVTNTYKFELQYAPVQEFRLRGSFERAIRAPSITELYTPQLVVTEQLGSDPCAPTFNANGSIKAPPVYSLAQCLNTRGPVSQANFTALYNANAIPQGTAGQLSGLTGGSTALQPEIAKTYTIGINFAPLPNFSGSIDYYHILVTGEIGTIAAPVIFSECANTANPFYCSQIFRNPRTAGLNTIGAVSGGGYVIQTNVNIGQALVSGVDLQANYRADLAANLGSVVFDLTGVYLAHNDTTPVPGAHTYNCAGYFGATCETVNPRWHHIFRATWQTPWSFSATASWRFLGPVSQDNNSPDPTLRFATFGAYDFFNAHIPAYSYLDLQATWNAARQLEIRAGINNVLDKDPPLLNTVIVPGGAANTNPVYDMFGRELFVAFTARF